MSYLEVYIDGEQALEADTDDIEVYVDGVEVVGRGVVVGR